MKRAAPWVLALAAALLLALQCLPRDPAADRAWRAEGTTYSPGPEGAKALYLLLQRLGMEVDRGRRPAYAELPAESVLWVLGRDRPSRVDRQQLAAFLERGGTLVAPPSTLALVLEASERETCKVEDVPHPGGAVRVAELELDVAKDPAWLTHCRAADEVHAALGPAAIVAQWNVGRGRAVSLGFEGLAHNERIGRAQNGVFLARVASKLGKKHVFDEVSTGFGEGNFWSLLGRLPYAWALAQLALAGALAVWALARRRLPAEPPVTVQRRRTLDHVDAVARLWQHAGDAAMPLEAILRGLNERARARGAHDAESPFLARLERMQPNLAARAREVWHNAERLSHEPRPAPEAVRRAVIDLESLEWEISKPWAKRPVT